MMSSSEPGTPGVGPFHPVSMQYNKIQRQYQQLLDRVTPFVLYRWLGFVGILALFILRIVLAQGVSDSSQCWKERSDGLWRDIVVYWLVD